MPKDPSKQGHRGIGFVTYASPESGACACFAKNNSLPKTSSKHLRAGHGAWLPSCTPLLLEAMLRVLRQLLTTRAPLCLPQLSSS